MICDYLSLRYDLSDVLANRLWRVCKVGGKLLTYLARRLPFTSLSDVESRAHCNLTYDNILARVALLTGRPQI
jgi:hypothetical protein